MVELEIHRVCIGIEKMFCIGGFVPVWKCSKLFLGSRSVDLGEKGFSGLVVVVLPLLIGF